MIRRCRDALFLPSDSYIDRYHPCTADTKLFWVFSVNSCSIPGNVRVIPENRTPICIIGARVVGSVAGDCVVVVVVVVGVLVVGALLSSSTLVGDDVVVMRTVVGVKVNCVLDGTGVGLTVATDVSVGVYVNCVLDGVTVGAIVGTSDTIVDDGT